MLATGAGWEAWIVFFAYLSCLSFHVRPLDMTAIMYYSLGLAVVSYCRLAMVKQSLSMSNNSVSMQTDQPEMTSMLTGL